MTIAMHYSWDRRVGRAHELAAATEDARPLLTMRARLLELQRGAAEAFSARIALRRHRAGSACTSFSGGCDARRCRGRLPADSCDRGHAPAL